MMDRLVGYVEAVSDPAKPVDQRLAVSHVVFLVFSSLVVH